jgi:outer membrane lipoprotein-sorting protein
MRPLANVALRTVFVLVAIGPVKATPPGAEQILTKAEEIRNPDLDYAVDFTIHTETRGATVSERDTSYSMIASGKDRTVILLRSPDELYGALVLMANGTYWMLLPKTSKPWELSAAQMINGDLATGDLARADLTRGYTATLSGEEPIDGAACWRLELHSTSSTARYTRIVYWVAKKRFLPRRLEHYGRMGRLIKIVRYGNFRKGALGLRSMRLDIESIGEWKEESTLSFANLREIDSASMSFTPDGMIAFRDAAIAAREGVGDKVPLERILRALVSLRESRPNR